MNIASLAPPLTETSLKKEVGLDYPTSRLLINSFLPLVTFLSSFLVAWRETTSFTPYLPLSALLIAGVTARWRGWGMMGSLLALSLIPFFLFMGFSTHEKYWQGGILASLALDCVILHLSLEQIRIWCNGYEITLEQEKKKQLQAEKTLAVLHKSKEEAQKELEDEIERLKAEAEQRRIERVRDTEQIEWLYRELEQFHLQKESVLNEARTLRSACPERVIEERVHEVLPAGLEKDTLLLQEKILTLQTKSGEGDEALKRSFAQVQGRYLQLRQQFDEKNGYLAEARRALFQAEEKLEVLRLEKEENAYTPFPRSELEEEISQLTLQVEEYASEIGELESMISSLLAKPT